ncbi:ATP-grasp domain-containing protein [Streptomyces zhihengii]|uniref:ATP-grasp domain-containing protein n=1 Tax=Streptomyces zhihengii TaxID=1818004 RepID=UPI00368BC51A
MTIASLESLSFGLGRTAEAAAAAGHRLCLLTADRSVYLHELSVLPAGAVTVVDVDTFDRDAVRRALGALPGLAGLINTTDTWSLPAAELAAEFGLPGPDPAAVRVLRDKAEVRRRLHAAGLSAGAALPVAADPSAAGEVVRRIGLPAVVKDRSGTSSRDVWITPDKDALRRALAEAGERGLDGRLFAEPYLAGPLYSAETLGFGGETRLLGVFSRQTSRRPAVREEAAAFPVALGAELTAEVAGWVGRVLAAAGHTDGFAHVEFVLTAQGPELVEINRRIGGALVGEALCRALGTNVYEALVATTLGRRPALLDGLRADGAAGYDGDAVAFVLVYADRPGTLTGWDGLDGLAAFPGAVRWYPTREPGAVLAHTGDQRGCTGMVWAEGPTAELAMHRAWSAAVTVRPLMRDAAAG